MTKCIQNYLVENLRNYSTIYFAPNLLHLPYQLRRFAALQAEAYPQNIATAVLGWC